MRVLISVIYDWEKGLFGAKGDKLSWEAEGRVGKRSAESALVRQP